MEFYDELKSRSEEVSRRVAEAQKELQVAQSKFQAVAQENNAIQHLLAVEAARRVAAAAEKNAIQKKIFPEDQNRELPAPVIIPVPETQTQQATPSLPPENQTDAVRNLLNQHTSGGISPTDMWKQLRNQIKHRAYFYSILKRLRDKDEVSVKRGKYSLKVVPLKVEEAKERIAAIH